MDATHDLVENKRLAWQVPGVTVAIVASEAAQIICAGAADLSRRRPVTAATTYPLGSLTKSLTSLAITDAIPPDSSFWDTGVDLGAGTSSVQPAHLLSHSSGVPSYELFFAANEAMSLTEVAEKMIGLPTIGPPSTRYLYSNMGYLAACRLAERWLHQDWTAFFDDFNRRALGIDRSNADPELRTRPYTWIAGDLEAGQPGDLHVTETLAPLRADSWVDATTACDFLRLHLFGETSLGNVVDRRTLEFTQSPRISTPDMGYPPGIAGESYALGWVRGHFRGLRMVAHAGFVGSTAAQYVLLPDEGVGIAVMLNTDNRRHYNGRTCCFRCSVAFDILAKMLDLPPLHDDEPEKGFYESPNDDVRKEHLLHGGEELAAAVGIYENPSLGTFEIMKSDGRFLFNYGAVTENLVVHAKSRIVHANSPITFPYPISFRPIPTGLKVKIDPYVAALDFRRIG
jgi:CubicO group peptidase (beta-lactamase class C family)